jgi:hypothetical protein
MAEEQKRIKDTSINNKINELNKKDEEEENILGNGD